MAYPGWTKLQIKPELPEAGSAASFLSVAVHFGTGLAVSCQVSAHAG
jgi:hypothetical protein